jgi:hypothetical protein
MADPVRLSQAVRADIAEQISERFGRPGPFLTLEATNHLGDSLKVMLLTVKAAKRSAGSLEDRLVDTGQWHHQILRANMARSFARSVPASKAADAKHEVVEVARSDLPQAVEDSLNAAMAAAPPDAEARLIVAPSYQLNALWLTGPQTDQVSIVAAPGGPDGLEAGQRFTGDQFVRRVANLKPIAGLGPPPEMRELV